MLDFGIGIHQCRTQHAFQRAQRGAPSVPLMYSLIAARPKWVASVSKSEQHTGKVGLPSSSGSNTGWLASEMPQVELDVPKSNAANSHESSRKSAADCT